MAYQEKPVNYEDQDHHDVTKVEHDEPKSGTILLLVIITMSTLVVVVLGIVQFFDIAARHEIEDKVLSAPSSALRDLRAMEKEKLSRTVWVDQKKGLVRIPAERALALTVRDWDQRPSGLVEVKEDAPAPAAPVPAAPGAPVPAVPGAVVPGAAPGAAPAGSGTPAPPPAEGGTPR